MEEVHTIGIVKGGKFIPLNKENSIEVTEIGMVEASTPTPINLSEYEGKVIMIGGQNGQGSGEMIYNAKIEDVANPILSAVAIKVFKKSGV